MRIESETFSDLSGQITIPSSVLFVAHDASPDPSRLSLCDEDSCPEFGRWLGKRGRRDKALGWSGMEESHVNGRPLGVVVGSNALCATGSRLEFKNPSKPLPQI
jgi:hypothetical protein